MTNPVYKLEVNNTLKSAWQHVRGSKKTFWSAIPLLFVATLLFNVLAGFFRTQPFFHFIIQITAQIVMFLLQLGLIFLGVQRAMDLPIQHNMFYRGFDSEITWKAIGLYFLQMIIIFPFILMGIFGAMYPLKDHPDFTDPNNPDPFRNMTWQIFFENLAKYPVSIAVLVFSIAAVIYFGIRMSMSIPFLVDKKFGPGHALAASFQATRANFWRILSVFIALIALSIFALIPLVATNLFLAPQTEAFRILMLISFLILIVCYIWFLPFVYICIGTIYRKLLANAVLA